MQLQATGAEACRKPVLPEVTYVLVTAFRRAKLDLLQERDGLLLLRHLDRFCKISLAKNY